MKLSPTSNDFDFKMLRSKGKGKARFSSERALKESEFQSEAFYDSNSACFGAIFTL